MVTELGAPDKLIPFGNSPHVSYDVDTVFGKFPENLSPFVETCQ